MVPITDAMSKREIDDELRDRMYRAVYEEFVGPIDHEAREVISTSPTEKYGAGVLHPVGAGDEGPNDDQASGHMPSTAEAYEDDLAAVELPSEAIVPEKGDEFEEPISLSNLRLPAAMSMTVAVRESDKVSLVIRWATYRRASVEGKAVFERTPYQIAMPPEELTIPRSRGEHTSLTIFSDPDNGKRLDLLVVCRRHIEGADVLTFALRNRKEDAGDGPESCFFQTSLEVRSELGLVPPVWTSSSRGALTQEEASNLLIYRNVNNYAIGHGCATSWDHATKVSWARTETMPIAETRAMSPMHKDMDGIELPIEMFGAPSEWESTVSAMRSMCERYASWIDGTERKAKDLPEEHREAADRNIGLCRECLRRIEDGISVLESDELARRAFIMANEAMYEQYLHYSVVSHERKSFDEKPAYVRQWRAFQLAFILMNIRPMTDEGCDERDVVDLIWFPTGGGKTEAYLGLSAFVLIHERLRGTTSAGVTVFMRYTLRLLTSQQFDRASSLICALEAMRRRVPDVLGDREFRIGLWVGGDASPNNRKEAVSKLGKYIRDSSKSAKNPFPVNRCPWCGTEMRGSKAKSYRRVGPLMRVGFFCANPRCEYSGGDGLPLDVVDDEIYERPPSLLVGTVDKFAMIPYRPESLRLFGIVDGERLAPPKLVIQDELHLISGPLGSMAAHYETLISSLCERETEKGGLVLPKVIASTATVSRAKEQCNQLYACGEDNVFQSPPSGIDYNDSFFSVEDDDERPYGRRYVGVFVPSHRAEASTNIKLYSDLMWEPATWEDAPDEWKDFFWTTVGYYGTTRELGQAVTWWGGDIPERLWEHRKRAEEDGKPYERHLRIPRELTGRKDADEVRSGLDALETSYAKDRDRTVDLCFATNMISVGLDVGRLGLMVVAGQPKSTAEYIQATSRVGRGSSKGIVFVVYSTSKPRDRSHYENFTMFHDSFYQDVEPSSVTGFCRQVRDRALFGTLVGIYRSLTDGVEDDAYAYPHEEAFDFAADTLIDRVDRVDPEESEGLEEDIERRRREWETGHFQRWDELNHKNPKPLVPLMHPAGAKRLDEWGDDTFDVPTSMRNVDGECLVTLVGAYGGYEGESDV